MVKKIIHVGKKSINFDFIKVYKVSPNFAGETSRWPRPNSKTNWLKFIETPSVVPLFQTFDVSKRSYRFLSKIQQKVSSYSFKKKHEPDKNLRWTRITSSHLIRPNYFSLSTEKIFSFNGKVGCCQSDFVQWLVEYLQLICFQKNVFVLKHIFISYLLFNSDQREKNRADNRNKS